MARTHRMVGKSSLVCPCCNDGKLTMSDHTIRVLLVDDQPMLRTGLATVLSTEPGLEVVGEASNGHEAIDKVAQLAPDVVCMDVQMPDMDGIEATRPLVEGQSHAAILILCTFHHADSFVHPLRRRITPSAGASSSPRVA